MTVDDVLAIWLIDETAKNTMKVEINSILYNLI